MQELIKALSAIDGIVAVGLGGSRGLGLADENSDYDFVLFRNSGDRIGGQIIVDAIKPYADAANIRTHSSFVMAQAMGKKIEIFQHDLSLIEREISTAREGKFRWSIRPLFPHGSISTGLISHIIHLELCFEQGGCVSKLRRLAQPFPDSLMRSLINVFLRQAGITVTHASKIKKAADLQYLIALCSGFVFYANVVIFSINRQYPVIERGGAKLIFDLPLRPKNYERRITMLFQASSKGDVRLVIAELAAMLAELRTLANKALEGSTAIDVQGVALKVAL